MAEVARPREIPSPDFDVQTTGGARLSARYLVRLLFHGRGWRARPLRAQGVGGQFRQVMRLSSGGATGCGSPFRYSPKIS